MRVSRAQAAENRDRILEIASRLFREHGLDGIGVADLMKGAGLTHGGFYGHFASKEELMAQDCERAQADSLAKWQEQIEAAPENPLAALAGLYLSMAHRDRPGDGCVLAALASEAARHDPPVRYALTGGLRRLVEVLAQVLLGRSKDARRG